METEAGGSSPDFVTTFDWTTAETVAAAVIDAVATAARVDPTDIDPLYEFIDPDALNELFDTGPRSDGSGPVVEFPYNDMLVQVRASGAGRVVPHR